MPRKAKKNAQGAGTIRKRSDGRWEARYTVGFDPAIGKQKQKSIYGKTQKEVREQLAEITTELDSGTYIEPSKMTLEAWMTVWLEDYMFDKKWSTIKHYKAQAKAHILPALGKVPPPSWILTASNPSTTPYSEAARRSSLSIPKEVSATSMEF